MKCASARRMQDILRLTPAQTRAIRKVAKAHSLGVHRLNAGYPGDPLYDAISAIPECESTPDYARSCYNSPWIGGMWRTTLALHAINAIAETCGVESMGAPECLKGFRYEYLNAGDTYTATLVYDRSRDYLMISSWGDIAERISL